MAFKDNPGRCEFQTDEQYLNCTRLFPAGKPLAASAILSGAAIDPSSAVSAACSSRAAANRTTIEIGGRSFLVLDINKNNSSMRIARIDLLDDFCPDRYDYAWPNDIGDLLRYTPNVDKVYICSTAVLLIQIYRRNETTTLSGVLGQGFEVGTEWKGQARVLRVRNLVGYVGQGRIILPRVFALMVDLVSLYARIQFELEKEQFLQPPTVDWLGFNITCHDNKPVDQDPKRPGFAVRIYYKKRRFCAFRLGVLPMLVSSVRPCAVFLPSMRTPFSYGPAAGSLLLYDCELNAMGGVFAVDCANNASHHSFAVFHVELLEHWNYSLSRSGLNLGLKIGIDARSEQFLSRSGDYSCRLRHPKPSVPLRMHVSGLWEAYQRPLHVLTAPQGTRAVSIQSGEFYQLTGKSDVYSLSRAD
ncbi:hypothetical protein DH2020_038664 [Rehmannia glutinosa]|uniref:Uncharacterized protein n=1 Tax=Rehmannia glutinosa TaxID=99300 RepID=A0ABR0UYK8_REHGL